MSKTLVGIVTFGNLKFTKLAVQSIKDTSKNPIDFFLIVGKPGDTETINWLNDNPDIGYKVHSENRGFPASVNDIYDYAWKDNNYDNLILAGNDTIAYPGCVDSLIELADTSEYLCISATQYDVNQLVSQFPEVENQFIGGGRVIEDFSNKPWEKYTGYSQEQVIADMQLYDIQNMCLYKKALFDAIGYTDVAFYPAYFVDNDYARRIVLSGLKCCSLPNARFFHFWSRTIYQENGGSTDRNFRNNEAYYYKKWGGPFGGETLSPSLLIDNRIFEDQIINHWKNS